MTRRLVRRLLIAVLALAAAPDARGAPPRTDYYGDPLPEGAVARMGTTRWWLGGHMNAVAFSPDGKMLATAADEAVVVCWAVATGKEVFRFRASANSLVYAPDGKSLAVVDRNGRRVQFRDAATGKKLHRFRSPDFAVHALAFSPDGKRLALVNDIETIRLVAAATGKVLHQGKPAGAVRSPPDGIGWPEVAAVFTPDGKRVATSCPAYRSVHLWDAGTGKLLHRLAVGDVVVPALAASPDGKVLATGGGSGHLRLWNTVTGREIRRFDNQKSTVDAVTFTPDGKTLVARGIEVTLWDVSTGKRLRSFPAPMASSMQGTLSPGGELVAGESGKRVRLWDVRTGKERSPGAGYEGGWFAAFSPDGKVLASLCSDKTIRLWEPTTGKLLARLPIPGEIASLVFFPPGGRAVAIWSRDWKRLEVVSWDMVTGKSLAPRRVPADCADGELVPQANVILVSGKGGSFDLYDFKTGKKIGGREARKSKLVGLAVSPDGRAVATAEEGGIIYVWEAASGRDRRRLGVIPGRERLGLPANEGRAGFGKECLLAFSPDGRRLVSTDEHEVIVLWDVVTGKEVRRFIGHAYEIMTVIFSPDGKLLASAGRDNTARIWDVATGEELASLTGHEEVVGSLAFSPDGRLLATGGADANVLVWDVAAVCRRRRAAIHPTARPLERLWGDLAGDAAAAYDAICALGRKPGKTVPFLRQRLRPVAPPDAKRIARLIAALDAESYAAREEAARELQKLGELAVPALRTALKSPPSLEVRRRAEKLLPVMEQPDHSPPALRELRAVEVLEQVGTAEARRLLGELAKGAPEARLTREAKESLRRLADRDKLER